METLSAAATVCSVCGERVNIKAQCLACLLRAGLDEGAQEDASAPTSLVFGDFEIARREDGSFWELGRGAMGVTYLATDRVLHRSVALKVIEAPAAAGDSTAVRERFLREARAAAALKHPNVAGIFQFGASPEIDRCYYAMELIEGETLEALVRRDGPLKVELALEIAILVTRALIGAAAQGLIHRDLKPGNIMITRPDPAMAEVEVKVIDFGLAKATNAVAETDLTHGGFIGTPSFASPEQFGGAPADARSDIYSLGVTLWYSLTGQVPYPGKTIEEIRDRQQRTDLPVEQLAEREITAPLIDILRRTLALDPTLRPASAREMLAELECCCAKLALPEAFTPRRRQRKWAALIVTLATVAAIPLAFLLLRQKTRVISRNATPLPEKSVAVLPFENLSDDKENAFFTAGVQDEILADLARIADLKVISRTSVMQYKSGPERNLREIAKALDVSHVVEGSVQRVGGRIRVLAQLIDARTDTHLWAEHYDRDLADVFAIQSEIAQQIAAALKAKLAPEETVRLATKPTTNAQAYLLYLQANERARTAASKEDAFATDELYAKAIDLDPTFALAIARRSMWNSRMYRVGRRPQDKTLARALAEQALHLSPDLAEAHLASGICSYSAEKNYAAALKEFSTAAATLSNDPEILDYTASIHRRQGRWREAISKYQRAQDLDPRNVHYGGPETCALLRDWPAATAGYKRLLQIAPNDVYATEGLAFVRFEHGGDPATGKAILQTLPAGIRGTGGRPSMIDSELAQMRWDMSMLQRDYAGAENVLAEYPGEEFPSPMVGVKIFDHARTAFARGDSVSARRFLETVKPIYETKASDQPDEASFHAPLGLLYAYLGRKDEAIREGRLAVELCPESKDAAEGAVYASNLALVYARTGESEQAITLIERLLTTPAAAGITLAELRLRWEWDPLRANPRFEKILAGPEPKTVY